MMTPRNKLRSVTIAATISLMAMATAGSAIASSEGADLGEEGWWEVEIGVEDYTLDGELIETTIHSHEELTAESFDGLGSTDTEVLSSGSEYIPPPDANAGCRNVWTTVSFSAPIGMLYELENRIYFCYNRSTFVVSDANPSWSILYNDGLNQISVLTSDTGYYNFNNHGANSGYLNQRTWSVLRDIGVGTTSYYPRADIYARGNGSGYASWFTG